MPRILKLRDHISRLPLPEFLRIPKQMQHNNGHQPEDWEMGEA
jgi:hypothetical protein